MLDAWVARLLGAPGGWQFAAVARAADGTRTPLTPVSLADLGLGPLTVALATQKAGQGAPSELVQHVGLAFAAQMTADPAPSSSCSPTRPPLRPREGSRCSRRSATGSRSSPHRPRSPRMTCGRVPTSAEGRSWPARSTWPNSQLGWTRREPRSAAVIAALGRRRRPQTSAPGRCSTLSPSTVRMHCPGYPSTTPTPPLCSKPRSARWRPGSRCSMPPLPAAVAEPLPDGDEQVAARHVTVLRALLGQAQPVLPRSTLAAADCGGRLARRSRRPRGRRPTAPAHGSSARHSSARNSRPSRAC